jgi:hypothetical protein
VRETWAEHPDGDGILYRATDPGRDDENSGLRWRPSIFMRPEASRITLEIAAIRPERLQNISEADAIAEGVQGCIDTTGMSSLRIGAEGYKLLWDSINGKKHPFRSNPFVWVTTFRSLKGL